jgi:hypothetical protein
MFSKMTEAIRITEAAAVKRFQTLPFSLYNLSENRLDEQAFF